MGSERLINAALVFLLLGYAFDSAREFTGVDFLVVFAVTAKFMFWGLAAQFAMGLWRDRRKEAKRVKVKAAYKHPPEGGSVVVDPCPKIGEKYTVTLPEPTPGTFTLTHPQCSTCFVELICTGVGHDTTASAPLPEKEAS
jgi:hypothetical protein